MDALKLTEDQINDLEYAINNEDDPLVGARRWVSEKSPRTARSCGPG
jgi:hypothetical protein